MKQTAVVIIPVRSLTDGKSRLSPVLDPAGREALTRKILIGVIKAAVNSASVARVIVVSPDPLALREASRVASEVLPVLQHSDRLGLNEALAQATETARALGASTVLILPADLPLITSSDIDHLLRRDAAIVIAPDRHGTGTNALMLRLDAVGAPYIYQFGEMSYQKHRDEAHQLGFDAATAMSLGTSFDLDTPGDFERLSEMRPDREPVSAGSGCYV